MDTASLQQRLSRYLCDRVPYLADLCVTNIATLNNGWECEIYAFDITFSDRGLEQSKSMILKMYVGKEIPLLGPKHVREFNTLRQLSCDSYPVPEVYLLECDELHLGSPIVIMERIMGKALDEIFRDAADEKRGALLAKMCQLLVSLHSLNWRGYEEDCPQKEQGAISLEIDRHWQLGLYFGTDYALPALSWLEEQSIGIIGARLSLAHWDFNPSNILLDSDDDPYVIDWSGAYVTDYRFDLAWSTLFLGPLAPQFISLYAKFAGKPVLDFDFFLAFAYFRRIMTMVISMEKGAEILGMRPGTTEVIRKEKRTLQTLYEKWLSMSGVRMEHVERVIAAL